MPRRPAIALAAAGLGAFGLVVDWILAFHVPFAESVDRHVLQGFAGLNRGPIATVADILPHFSDPQPFTVLALVVVGFAFVRGRPRLALAAAVIMLGANLCTQWLKPPLSLARHSGLSSPIDLSLWPSGHATASMALCLAAVLVSPASRRPLVAGLGAAYSLAVTFTLLVAVWHFPSDVIAGYLMAGTWTSLVVAALWASEPGRARTGTGAAAAETDVRHAVAPPALVALAGVVLAVVVTFARPVAVGDYVRGHTTFVIGAAVIAALGLSLAAALSAAMTATRRAPAIRTGPAPTAAPRRRWRPGRG